MNLFIYLFRYLFTYLLCASNKVSCEPVNETKFFLSFTDKANPFIFFYFYKLIYLFFLGGVLKFFSSIVPSRKFIFHFVMKPQIKQPVQRKFFGVPKQWLSRYSVSTLILNVKFVSLNAEMRFRK